MPTHSLDLTPEDVDNIDTIREVYRLPTARAAIRAAIGYLAEVRPKVTITPKAPKNNLRKSKKGA